MYINILGNGPFFYYFDFSCVHDTSNLDGGQGYFFFLIIFTILETLNLPIIIFSSHKTPTVLYSRGYV